MPWHCSSSSSSSSTDALDLKVTNAWSSSYGTAPLQLGHLSALTQLELPGIELQAGDMLPPQLQVMRVGSCAVAQQLLALQQLRVLGMDESKARAGQLLQLSKLGQLSEVELRYRHSPYLNVALTAAAAWRFLPVKKLVVAQWDPISTAVVEQLGTLSGLTHLGLGSLEYVSNFEATPQQLATQLARLTALRQLEVFCSDFHPAALLEAGAMRALMQAVASLPQLVHLHLHSMAKGDAVAELAAATKLTHLGITLSDLDDATLAVLATSLVRLQSLNLIWNTSITGASLTALAAASQLTYLALDACSVNDTNLALLAKPPMQLHSLGLRGIAAITDESVAVLAAHQQQLTCLDVGGTSMTVTALQQLRKSLRKLVQLNGVAVA